MRNKEKLTMYIDIIKITIIICWVSLIGFWLIKLFGGNWFEIIVTNENFLKFSDLVQNSWLKYLVSFITIVGGNYLLFGAISQQLYFTKKQLIYVIPMLLSMWIVVNFIPDFLALSYWYGYFILVCFGAITQIGWKKLFGVLAVALDTLFVLLSFLTRNIKVEFQENYLILLILIIDLYIMYALFYLYSNLIKIKKEKK